MLTTIILGGVVGYLIAQLRNQSDATKALTRRTPPPTNRSPRLQTAYDVLEGYSKLSADVLVAPLAPNGTHKVLPESLEIPTRDRAAFAQHAKGFTSIFSAFEMQPQMVWEAPEQNSVIAYCKMVGTLVADLGPWHNECVITMKMSEDGRQVVEYREFVDSARAAILKEKLGKFFASKQKAQTLMSQ